MTKLSSGENHRDTLEAWFREPKVAQQVVSQIQFNIVLSVEVVQVIVRERKKKE
jgi:hypothetical protein